MIIFKIKHKRQLGKSKGTIVLRHRKNSKNSMYVPVDRDYFKYAHSTSSYFILYDIKTNLFFRNVKLILSLCIKGDIKGMCRYILKPNNKIYGDFIKFYNTSKKTSGDVDLLQNFFISNKVYNISSPHYSKFRLCTSAGANAVLVSITATTVLLKLPSNTLKYLNNTFFASYSSSDKIINLNSKKAGYNVLYGKRPKVRGTAMNACDHPHGGGEGKSPIGRKTIYSFVGRKCKGIKTVHKN